MPLQKSEQMGEKTSGCSKGGRCPVPVMVTNSALGMNDAIKRASTWISSQSWSPRMTQVKAVTPDKPSKMRHAFSHAFPVVCHHLPDTLSNRRRYLFLSSEGTFQVCRNRSNAKSDNPWSNSRLRSPFARN